ncbi:hypothetical protein RAD15_25380 [Bradyrhizobium sp. 14AA]
MKDMQAQLENLRTGQFLPPVRPAAASIQSKAPLAPQAAVSIALVKQRSHARRKTNAIDSLKNETASPSPGRESEAAFQQPNRGLNGHRLQPEPTRFSVAPIASFSRHDKAAFYVRIAKGPNSTGGVGAQAKLPDQPRHALARDTNML